MILHLVFIGELCSSKLKIYMKKTLSVKIIERKRAAVLSHRSQSQYDHIYIF